MKKPKEGPCEALDDEILVSLFFSPSLPSKGEIGVKGGWEEAASSSPHGHEVVMLYAIYLVVMPFSRVLRLSLRGNASHRATGRARGLSHKRVAEGGSFE